MARESLRDQIALLNDPATLRKPAFHVINRMQSFRPGEQVMGMALALVVICESTGLSIHDVLSKAQRMTAPADGPFVPHIQAIRDYAVRELVRRFL